MSRQYTTKINRLFSLWPQGTVVVQSLLKKQGIYRQLIKIYLNSHWLVKIGSGAYARPNDNITWSSGLYSIQNQLYLDIHAGGKTSLYLQGYSHNISNSEPQNTFFFGFRGVQLPAWFKTYNWKTKINYIRTNLFNKNLNIGFTEYQINTYTIKISSLERAIMEMLYLVPQKESIEEAQLIMEGLTTLRPNIINELLNNCNSIKVKRLFLYIADKLNMPWFKKININKINLGKGKRTVIPGGKFNSKYNITVLE